MMFYFILNILCKVYFIVEFSLFLRVKRIEFKPSKFFCQDFSLCQKGPSSYAYWQCFWLIEKSKQKFWRLEFNSFEPQIIPYQIQYYTTTENTLFSKACLSSDAVSTLFFPKGQYTKNSQRGVLPTAIFTIPKRAEEFPWLATRSTAEKAASASSGAKPR